MCRRSSSCGRADILVFMDGDGSDVPAEMGQLLQPILAGDCDFVIGSRMRGKREPGSMLVSQIFAGWLAGILLRLLYRVSYTDMGPFRAITRRSTHPSCTCAKKPMAGIWRCRCEPPNLAYASAKSR